MKNIVYISLSIMFLNSCNVLDQEPASLIPADNAIVDRQSAEAAINGVYDLLQDGELYGGRFILATEMLAENARAAAFQAFWKELESGQVPASNFHVEDNWVDYYAVINAANTVLANVPDIEGLSQSESDRLLGTAYFMRALSFFDLLRQFGEFYDTGSEFGIPLKLVPSNSITEIPRSSVAASYQQIVDDLDQAIDMLTDHSDKFYASRGAAQALLARVHLYQQNYDQAATLATTVIDNSNYVLSDDYNTLYESEGSAESIFELNFIALDDPNTWSIEMYVSPPEVTVSEDLIEFFEANPEPERGEKFEEIGEFIRCTKYGRAREDEGTNTIILRLSEMYLIRAEALGMSASGSPSDALTDINAVRNRAELADLSDINSEEELIDILLRERRAEFAFEGHYWFDMVRLDRMEETTGRESFRRIFPIPRRELNITEDVLTQNPGYQ